VVALHTAIAIVLAVGLIIAVKVDPVISLLLASLYLGLASGVGFTGTIEAIAMGFGEIMAEVGLLIGFGVLIGAFLHNAGAFHRLLDVFVRVIGATRLPYALSLLHSTILPSIYVRRAGRAGLASGPLSRSVHQAERPTDHGLRSRR
jgi:GntP family gluconate:H+ symporter